MIKGRIVGDGVRRQTDEERAVIGKGIFQGDTEDRVLLHLGDIADVALVRIHIGEGVGGAVGRDGLRKVRTVTRGDGVVEDIDRDPVFGDRVSLVHIVEHRLRDLVVSRIVVVQLIDINLRILKRILDNEGAERGVQTLHCLAVRNVFKVSLRIHQVVLKGGFGIDVSVGADLEFLPGFQRIAVKEGEVGVGICLSAITFEQLFVLLDDRNEDLLFEGLRLEHTGKKITARGITENVVDAQTVFDRVDRDLRTDGGVARTVVLAGGGSGDLEVGDDQLAVKLHRRLVLVGLPFRDGADVRRIARQDLTRLLVFIVDHTGVPVDIQGVEQRAVGVTIRHRVEIPFRKFESEHLFRRLVLVFVRRLYDLFDRIFRKHGRADRTLGIRRGRLHRKDSKEAGQGHQRCHDKR